MLGAYEALIEALDQEALSIALLGAYEALNEALDQDADVVATAIFAQLAVPNNEPVKPPVVMVHWSKSCFVVQFIVPNPELSSKYLWSKSTDCWPVVSNNQ